MGRSARRMATQTFEWKSNIVGTFLHAHRLHKALVDVYIYPVLEGLAEISSTRLPLLFHKFVCSRHLLQEVSAHWGLCTVRHMAVWCKNAMIVVITLTVKCTLTCVAGHLGDATHGSISEAMQLVTAAIFLFVVHATTLDGGIMVKPVRVISLFTQMTIITSS